MKPSNAPFREAKQLYRINGGDFPGDLDWMLRYGVVVNTPNTFLMGYFFRESDPATPTTGSEADGVFVVLCVGEPKSALHQLVDLVPLVAYERAFRGDKRVRILNLKKYYSKL
jgi:hypothetical protein